MVELYWGDQKIEAKDITNIEVAFDESDKRLSDKFDVPPMLRGDTSFEGTFTVKFSYWGMKWMAKEVMKHNPKKGKHIDKIVERTNPLRLLGLL